MCSVTCGSKARVSTNLFYKSTVELWIGHQKIDSHRYDFMSDVWPSYLADTWTKSSGTEQQDVAIHH